LVSLPAAAWLAPTVQDHEVHDRYWQPGFLVMAYDTGARNYACVRSIDENSLSPSLLRVHTVPTCIISRAFLLDSMDQIKSL
jgi:hypothetical protein